jgi:hypothetical protein
MLLKHYDITQFGARPPSRIPGESTKRSNSDEELNSKSCVKRNSDSKKRNKYICNLIELLLSWLYDEHSYKISFANV